MALKTGKEYLESIAALGLEAHILGRQTADLEDPVAGPYIRKYLAASPEGSAADRMKVLRLIENLVAGAVGYLIESMHGAGPPMAQRIMIGRQADLEGKIQRVKGLLGID